MGQITEIELKELIDSLDIMSVDNPKFHEGVNILMNNMDALDKLGLEAVRKSFDIIAKDLKIDEVTERKIR